MKRLEQLGKAVLQKVLSRLPPDEDQIVEKLFLQILTAIYEKDTRSIIELFSPNALSQIENIQEQVNRLFVLSENYMDTWARLGGNVSKSVDYGIVVKKYAYSYKLHPDSQYIIFIKGCFRDDTDRNNEGLHSIVLYKKEQWAGFPGPGIAVQI